MGARAAAILAAAAIAAACAPAEPALSLELTDHSITAARGSVPTGHLVFLIHNAGTTVHELEVVRAGAAGDELAYDSGRAQAVAKDVVAEREAILVGATKRLSVDLVTGRYLLICNLPGHYAAGMRLAIEAR